MSIQWTLAAGFLYIEIAVVIILILPILSPKKWQSLFRSRIVNVLGSHTVFYFYLLLLLLGLLLLDAFREMRKYASVESGKDAAANIHTEMQTSLRMFRAQRNFYISGFALFLALVINRLITLISSLAQAQASNEASLKQAQSASAAARSYLAAQAQASNEASLKQAQSASAAARSYLAAGAGESRDNTSNEAHDTEVNKLKDQIKKLKDDLDKEKKDKDAIKKQAESTNKEYDRLTEEYSKLQKKVDAAAGASGGKKGE